MTVSWNERKSSCLSARETEVFYAVLLLWTIILLVMSFYRLASAYILLILVIFPLIVRVLIFDNFIAAKMANQNVIEKSVLINIIASLIPVKFCTYLLICGFDVLLPIMSRSGTETPPDLFIAVLCASAVVTLTSYMVSIFLVQYSYSTCRLKNK